MDTYEYIVLLLSYYCGFIHVIIRNICLKLNIKLAIKQISSFLAQNNFYGPKIHFALDGQWVRTLEGPIKPYTLL